MRLGLYILISFGLGCLLMFLVSANFRTSEKSLDKAAGPCEQEINIALGHATVDSIPILDRTLRLLDSNRVDDARSILRNYTWWQLEDAWEISQEYHGDMSNELDTLLTNVYPSLRRQVRIDSFTNFPEDYLVQMSNFEAYADRKVSTNGTSAPKSGP